MDAWILMLFAIDSGLVLVIVGMNPIWETNTICNRGRKRENKGGEISCQLVKERGTSSICL